jgi:predicted RNA binding protein YcfA (HicA-like mRNA interferase family)
MEKLIPLPAKKMIKIILSLGFKLLRTKGSHNFFQNINTGKTTVIPLHNNEVLGSGILKEILKDIGISVDEYEKLRRKK